MLRIETLVSFEQEEEKQTVVIKKNLDRLLLNEQLLRGKRVLDVGSSTGFFGYSLRQAGINCDVVDLDIRYQVGKPPPDASAVQANGLILPFSDEVFDLVISSGSLPILLAYCKNPKKTREKTRQFLDETIRVTKGGGEIHLGSTPIFGRSLYDWEFDGLYALQQELDQYIGEINSVGTGRALIENYTLIICKSKR